MANIPESNVWAEEVYELAMSDPVSGGAVDLGTKAGIDNWPHIQLARRTQYLKAEVESLAEALAGFSITGSELLGILGPVDGTGSGLDADLLDGLHASSFVRGEPGDVRMSFSNTLRSNELRLNGAAISRTIYSALFARIGTAAGVGDGSTTFNIPDARGMVFRIMDDGRGMDPGRTLASYQADQMAEHDHGAGTLSGTAAPNGRHRHRMPTYASSDGTARIGTRADGAAAYKYTEYEEDHTHAVSISGRTGLAGAGAETRMKNISLYGFIRYQ